MSDVFPKSHNFLARVSRSLLRMTDCNKNIISWCHLNQPPPLILKNFKPFNHAKSTSSTKVPMLPKLGKRPLQVCRPLLFRDGNAANLVVPCAITISSQSERELGVSEDWYGPSSTTTVFGTSFRACVRRYKWSSTWRRKVPSWLINMYEVE